MSENDPDPKLPDEGAGRSEFGGRPAPGAGDPTEGGREGQVGNDPVAAPGVGADEPEDGSTYPVGGGSVAEETDEAPVADPGPDA